MKRKYGLFKNIPVTLMEKASRGFGLSKEKVIIQSLNTGETKIILRTNLKGITTRYPKQLKA
jgi:hypothetical protein